MEAAAKAARDTEEIEVAASHAARDINLADADTKRGVHEGLLEPVESDPSLRAAPLAGQVVPPRHTATGAYGEGLTDAVQLITVVDATGGTFSLGFDPPGAPGPLSTAEIDFDATAAQVQAALEALASVNPGDVVCAGGPLDADPVTVTFRGQYAQVAILTMDTDAGALVGGAGVDATVAVVTVGGAAAP